MISKIKVHFHVVLLKLIEDNFQLNSKKPSYKRSSLIWEHSSGPLER